ncbi:MAG: hypothetical protein ACMUJM_16155 [bacterium]
MQDKMKECGSVWIFLFLSFLFSHSIFSPASAQGEDFFENSSYILRILSFGNYLKPADSTQNKHNDFCKISTYNGELDFRLDIYFSYDRYELSIKPRMTSEWKQWEDGIKKGDSEWHNDTFINEWLMRIGLIKNLYVSYGRENLQWGPSFLFSPSNPFFRDNGRSNPKQEIAGMDFARCVWLPRPAWTFSFIANVDQGRQDYRLTEFKKINALKVDYSGEEGYGGLIVSHREGDRTRIGAFGGRTVTDALLLYGEGVISRGSNALYPTKDETSPFGYSMEAVYDTSSSTRGIVLVGGAYTFEFGPTLTVEYSYNQVGYDDAQAEAYYRLREYASDAAAFASPMSDLAALTLSQTLDPQLRFLRKNYLMFQYYYNDIMNEINLLLQWTENLEDYSGQFIFNVEYFLGDHSQLFSIASLNAGEGGTEFGSLLEYQVMCGLEFTF